MADDGGFTDGVEQPHYEMLAEPPDYLRGHDSVWNATSALELQGVGEQDRQDFADAHYWAYVDKDMGIDERSQWRDYADSLRDEYGIELDWDAWRHEMGYD